jgi:hypothetical protein
MIRLYWWLSVWVILHNIQLKADLLTGRVIYKGDLNVTNLVSVKCAIGSAPNRGTACFTMEILTDFFRTKEDPIQP